MKLTQKQKHEIVENALLDIKSLTPQTLVIRNIITSVERLCNKTMVCVWKESYDHSPFDTCPTTLYNGCESKMSKRAGQTHCHKCGGLILVKKEGKRV